MLPLHHRLQRRSPYIVEALLQDRPPRLRAHHAVRVELGGFLSFEHGGFGAKREIAVGGDLERGLQHFHAVSLIADPQHAPRVFGAGATVVVEGKGGSEFDVVLDVFRNRRSQITSEKPYRILSLNGGAAKGFYSLGVLREIEGLIGKSLAEGFDLIFGTSAGVSRAGFAGGVSS